MSVMRGGTSGSTQPSTAVQGCLITVLFTQVSLAVSCRR